MARGLIRAEHDRLKTSGEKKMEKKEHRRKIRRPQETMILRRFVPANQGVFHFSETVHVKPNTCLG